MDTETAESEKRSITDADAVAIAKAMRQTLKDEFYQDLGKGVWDLFLRALALTAVSIMLYGAYRSGR